LAHDFRVLVRGFTIRSAHYICIYAHLDPYVPPKSERLQAGDTDAQVLDFPVARYSEFVLLKPRLSWRTAILWGLPPGLLLGGIALLTVAATRRRDDLYHEPRVVKVPDRPRRQEAAWCSSAIGTEPTCRSSSAGGLLLEVKHEIRYQPPRRDFWFSLASDPGPNAVFHNYSGARDAGRPAGFVAGETDDHRLCARHY